MISLGVEKCNIDEMYNIENARVDPAVLDMNMVPPPYSQRLLQGIGAVASDHLEVDQQIFARILGSVSKAQWH